MNLIDRIYPKITLKRASTPFLIKKGNKHEKDFCTLIGDPHAYSICRLPKIPRSR